MAPWTSAVIAAAGAFTAGAAMVASAATWVPASFQNYSSNARIAGTWANTAIAATARNVGPNSGLKSGDEDFWLTKQTSHAHALPAAAGSGHRISVGDRIALTGKSNEALEFEVVDVKPLDAALLPASDTAHMPPRLILVTCKPLGDAAAPLMRVVFEDVPTSTPALTGGLHKAL
jgi:hypothetical protein